MSDYKEIKDNWNKYLLETEIAKMSENGELLEEGLKDLAAKLGKKYGIPAMVALQMLTAAAPAMAAGDVAPEREVPVAKADVHGHSKTQIVNAWGAFRMKQDKPSLRNLMKVMKKHDIKKDLAKKIMNSTDQEEVKSLLDMR